MKIEITRTVDVEPPAVPTRLRIAGNKKATIDIASLDDDSIISIIAAWAEEFQRRAAARRANAASDQEATDEGFRILSAAQEKLAEEQE